MKMYGFWRSLASYRVRVALELKGLQAQEVSIDLLQGRQYDPGYTAINPAASVPALVVDGGPPLVQSLAILEYLEETQPQPALLPADPRGRARVRGLAQIVACDAHPLITPRVRVYLEKELRVEKAAIHQWMLHWTQRAVDALEQHLVRDPQAGRLCHGDAPTIADICLVSHVIGMISYLNNSPANAPTAMRIFEACMATPAFSRAHPLNQPGAAAHG